ncbi:MAG: sulfatase, partial [Verrucomicrobiota bacterium]
SQLQTWLKSTGAKFPQPNLDYKPVWAEQQRNAALKQKEHLEKQHAAFLNPKWQPDPTWWKSEQTKD